MSTDVRAEIDTVNSQFVDGADGVLDQGKYVVVWKRTDAGWRWHWDIWNSNSG